MYYYYVPNKLQPANWNQQTATSKLQPANYNQQTETSKLQPTNCNQQTATSKLKPANRISYCVHNSRSTPTIHYWLIQPATETYKNVFIHKNHGLIFQLQPPVAFFQAKADFY